MNTDIRLKIGFLDNTKIVKLQRRHGSDSILSLIRFWMYVAQNKPSGFLDGMDAEDIDIACGAHTFSMHDAMLDLGLLEKDGNIYKVHDWEKEQSWAANAEERSKSARMAAMERWKKKKKQTVKSNAERMHCAYNPHAEGNAPFLSFPFLSLPKEYAHSKEFAESWVEWEKYRQELKKVLKQTTVTRQINTLTKYPVSVSVSAINKSIESGWTGLFPEKIHSDVVKPQKRQYNHLADGYA